MLWPWTQQVQSSKDAWFVAIMLIWSFSLLAVTLAQREIYNLCWGGGRLNPRVPISFVRSLSCNRAALWRDGECDLYWEASTALAKWPVVSTVSSGTHSSSLEVDQKVYCNWLTIRESLAGSIPFSPGAHSHFTANWFSLLFPIHCWWHSHSGMSFSSNGIICDCEDKPLLQWNSSQLTLMNCAAEFVLDWDASLKSDLIIKHNSSLLEHSRGCVLSLCGQSSSFICPRLCVYWKMASTSIEPFWSGIGSVVWHYFWGDMIKI